MGGWGTRRQPPSPDRAAAELHHAARRSLPRSARTSTKPSTLPVTSSWPSGEKAAHSAWLLTPNLICRSRSAGKVSTSSRAPAAVPRNRSKAAPGGSMPCCCCLQGRRGRGRGRGWDQGAGQTYRDTSLVLPTGHRQARHAQHRLATHHLSAWPTSAMSRDGGTVLTSLLSECASWARRLSRGVPPYSSRASK